MKYYESMRRSGTRKKPHFDIKTIGTVIIVGLLLLRLQHKPVDTPNAGEIKLRQSILAGEKFLTFEPYDGTPNEIRMSWEVAIAYAYALNRTLVLPPPYRMHHLPGAPVVSLAEIMDVSALSDFVPTITYAEWRRLHMEVVGPVVSDKRAFNVRSRQSTELHSLFNGIEAVATVTNPPWPDLFNRVLCVPLVPSIIPKDLQTFAANRHLIDVPTNSLLQGETVHFPGNLYGLFYTMVYFRHKPTYYRLIEGMSKYFRYNRKVALRGARIADRMGGADNFVAVHVRRRDFPFPQSKPNCDTIVASIAKFAQPKEAVFIYTDEPDLSFFTPLLLKMSEHPVYFGSNFSAISSAPIGLSSPIQHVVCSHARIFIGTPNCTESAYIHRLRGYNGFGDNDHQTPDPLIYITEPVAHLPKPVNNQNEATTYDWTIVDLSVIHQREYTTGWVHPNRKQRAERTSTTVSNGVNGYLLFEPWDGHWNDVRESWENAIAYAFALNKTLVLPPAYAMHSMGGVTFQLASDMMDFQRLKELVPVISLDEWKKLHRQEIQQSTTTRPAEKPLSAEGLELRKEFEDVPKIATVTNPPHKYMWNIVLCVPSVPVVLPQSLSDFAAGRTLIGADDELFAGENVYFPLNFFGLWYMNVWFEDPDLRDKLTIGMRDKFRYNSQIQDAAQHAVVHLQKDTGSFVCIQVHRGPFPYQNYRPAAKEIGENILALFDASKPKEPLYVFTNEGNLNWFDPMREVIGADHPVYFLRNVSKIMGAPAWYTMEAIEQMLCAYARKYSGTYFSTTSGYVERLRGFFSGGHGETMYFIHSPESNPPPPADEDIIQWSLPKWKAAIWAREYYQGWPKNPLPKVISESASKPLQGSSSSESCEQVIRNTLRLPSTQKPPQNHWEVDKGVCTQYKDIMVKKLCVDLPGATTTFKDLVPVAEPFQLSPYLQKVKAAIEPLLLHGRYVHFTMVHLQDKGEVEQRAQYAKHMAYWFPEVILNYVNVTSHSFKDVHGKFPLLVANSESEAKKLKEYGFIDNVIIDPTDFFRHKTVAGSRYTSRTTITKYFFVYFILMIGYSPVFFDTDGFWLRQLNLPKLGEKSPVDVAFGFEYPQDMPGRSIQNPYVFSPLDRYMQSTNWFKWCPPNAEHIAINTGLMVWFPTEKAKRLLANQIDFVVSNWDYWWEQNLLSYIHYHHLSFGLKVSYWSPNTCNKYGYKPDCAILAPEYAWVHTKDVHVQPQCSSKLAAQPKKKEPNEDIQLAPITLELL